MQHPTIALSHAVQQARAPLKLRRCSDRRSCDCSSGLSHLSPPAHVISVFQDMPLAWRTREHTVGTCCSQLCFRRSKHSCAECSQIV
jgi:hypothetical protein